MEKNSCGNSKCNSITLYPIWQERPDKSNMSNRYTLGFKIGSVISDIESDLRSTNPFNNSSNLKKLIRPQFGLFFEIPINRKFEIRPEVNFASQGIRAVNSNIVLSTWLGYVQIPILIRGQKSFGSIILFSQFGPQIGVGIFVIDRLKIGDEVVEKTTDSFNDRNWKSFDAGIALGAGVEFPKAKGLELEVRYYKGLTNFENQAGAPELKNNSLQFSLGVKF